MIVCSSLITCSIEELTESIDASSVESLNSFEPSDGEIEQGIKQQVRLAHFSVKEYLLSDRHAFRSDFQVQICHAKMAESCLRYLLHISNTECLTKELVDQYPLARYAAEYWWQHAQQLDYMSVTVLYLALKLLNDSTALLSWAKLYDVMAPHRDPEMALTTSDLAQPLYYAASTGLPELVQSMFHETIDIDAAMGRYDNALRAASRHGHKKIVRIFLNARTNINAKKYDNGCALQVASYYDHEEVMRILLNAGVNTNADEGRYGNALEAAARRDSESICQLLLDARPTFNRRSSALHDAIYNLSILKMLLEAGVGVDARGRFDGTPLQSAVFYGQDATVQMLIAAGADVNASSGEWGSALPTACTYGYSKIAQMLLNAGARLQAPEDQEMLHKAAENGHENTSKILLDAGVDVNAQGDRYGYALQAASAYNHEAVVRMLLHAGANVNAQGGYFGNALQAASSDSEPVIEILRMPSDRIRWIERPICMDDELLVSLRSLEVTIKLLLHPTSNGKGQKGRHGIILEEILERIDKTILHTLLDAYDGPEEVSRRICSASPTR